VLLAPPKSYEDSVSDVEGGRYRDEPELIPGLDGEAEEEEECHHGLSNGNGTQSTTSFESGGQTPITSNHYAGSVDSEQEIEPTKKNVNPTPLNGNILPDYTNGIITSFPSIRAPTLGDERDLPTGIRGVIPRARLHIKRAVALVTRKAESVSQKAFHALPPPLQTFLTKAYVMFARFMHGLWEFMNPPLWAMLLAVIVASIPKLQRLFFEEGSFIANSVTRAVSQSGGVAVPLILVVLGANLARNTLPRESLAEDSEENQIGTKLMVASLISRMLLPTIVMAPMLALAAKHVPVSILDDPIFVIVCFLLTGAPSALQLAQICQINGVYEGVMSKLLFQSYVIWYVLLPNPGSKNQR